MDPYLVVVFFFKQKTAYEMRISDWSSDVCSSDLLRSQRNLVGAGRAKEFDMLAGHAPGLQGGTRASDQRIDDLDIPARRDNRDERIGELACRRFVGRRVTGLRISRSEEHTSELQSLMRISYAVFCLKKKNRYPP